MGKTVGLGNTNHKQVNMQGALGKHLGRYLDQYTIICVFGSVVGYVVMPLIGTVETLLLSVIVIGLSIHGFSKNQHKEDDRRRYREDKRGKKQQDPKKSLTVQVITDSESQHRRLRDENSRISKNEKLAPEDGEAERERRFEEKREKKAKKKEERNKKREEERKKNEKEEMARREKQEKRAMRRQQEKEAKEKARGFLLPTYETIIAMVSQKQKPVKRERKHSTSSTSSGSSSNLSQRSLLSTPPRLRPVPHPLPTRASSDPILYPSSHSLPWNSTNTVKTKTELAARPSEYASTQQLPDHNTTPVCTGRGICSNNAFTEWPDHSPETITAHQIWYPNDKPSCHNNSTLFTSSVWQHQTGGHDNQQQNGRLGPRVSPNGRFYSLFSNEHSSPFMDLHSSSEGLVINTERRLDDLADTSKPGSDQSFDEWPNI